MSKEYEIRTLADFQKVPNDNLAECLVDFLTLLQMWHEADKAPHPEVKVLKDRFIWFDDGSREITQIRIIAEDEV